MTLNGRLYGKGLIHDHKPDPRGILNDRHLMPPFSVLNTREAFWQNRKRKWLKWVGIRSEEGREDELTYSIPLLLSDGRQGRKVETQTSVFDPVLTELAYTWWAVPGGVILDPFAGGSVRGIVAAMLGYKYWGCELRQEQVDGNKKQLLEDHCNPHKPRWLCGDSLVRVDEAPAGDFIFSCPPYGPLEKYSDDPRDISNMTYEEFLTPYRAIIAKTVDKLKDNSFAAWVVGNFRDKETGTMYDFVGDTVRAFKRAGAAFYNDAVLINNVGSAAMRANTSFKRGHRKLVKLHQNLLTFVKGDPKLAAAKVAPIVED